MTYKVVSLTGSTSNPCQCIGEGFFEPVRGPFIEFSRHIVYPLPNYPTKKSQGLEQDHIFLKIVPFPLLF